LRFTQTIRVKVSSADELAALAEKWDDLQATQDVTGYVGARLLKSLDTADEYLLVVDFAEVEPGTSAREEAEKNNDRPATQDWAEELLGMALDSPDYGHYDEIYNSL
jgi:hypothetical protein